MRANIFESSLKVRIAVLVVIVAGGLTAVQLSLADSCTGDAKDTVDKCTESRTCDITENSSCLTELISASDIEKCVDGLPADNCIKSDTEAICALKYACSENTAGTECVTGERLDDANYFVPEEGEPGCTVGG